MEIEWIRALGQLEVGDIFHASYTNGASCICLIELTSDVLIRTRRITTQTILAFDRRTGVATMEYDRKTGTTLSESGAPCTIDSISPLPVDIHNVMLGLDRKMRLEPDWLKHKLDDGEKRALIFIGPFYAANPL